jgi:secreted trypsin-like serine protease
LIDTCQGDSGGPLMMFASSNQWVLVGLTSNGIGCARAADSGVYTRVAAFQDWININTNGAVTSLTSTVSTTVLTTIRTTARTTTFLIINSYANTIEISTSTIFNFILFRLLFIFFY